MKRMTTKTVVGVMCLALVIVTVICPLAVALDEDYWVVSSSETIAYAEGKGGLEVVTHTSSKTYVGDSIEEIIADNTGTTNALGTDYLILISNSKTTKHTPNYEKTTTIGSMTSTGSPVSFNGEQRINNLLDTDTPQNRKIGSTIENIVNIGDETFALSSMASFPLDEGQKNFLPSIISDFPPILSSSFDDLEINFDNAVSDTVEADGLVYTGGMGFGMKVKVSVESGWT